MQQLPTCILCHSESSFLAEKNGYTLYSCPTCTLGFVYPLPTREKLAEVYSSKSGYQGKKLQDLSQAPFDKKSQQVLSFLKHKEITGKLLDVGCSNGEFLYFSQRQGFDVEGIELNDSTVKTAMSHGFKVTRGTLEDVHFPDERFDVINLGDIIEHVPDPQWFIAECARILKPNGCIVISTPNLDCFWSKSTYLLYKWFKIPWSSIAPPFHLFQFSHDNLKKLAEQKGLELFGHWYNLPPRLGYELTSLGLLQKYKKSKKIMDFVYMGIVFSVYSSLYIVNKVTFPLRKKDFSLVAVYRKKS